MTVLLAGISGDMQYVKSLRSFYQIEVEEGDEKKEFPGGRGDVSRRLAEAYFIESKHSHILMLDVDMLHPIKLLSKLKAHNLDIVSGHYYARNSRNIHSIWCRYGDGKWPFPPMIDVPEHGLHQIGMTGMGNVLISKSVVYAVRNWLPKGDEAFAIGPCPPITGDNRSLGSDFRFFSVAQILGWKLWGDADIESKHATVFWLGRAIADKLKDDIKTSERLEEYSRQFLQESGMNAKFFELRIAQLEKQRDNIQTQKEQTEKNLDFLTRQMHALSTVISEDKWLLEQEKNLPKVEAGDGAKNPYGPDAFPVADNPQEVLDNRKGIVGVSAKEAKLAREGVLKREAEGFADDANAINSAR